MGKIKPYEIDVLKEMEKRNDIIYSESLSLQGGLDYININEPHLRDKIFVYTHTIYQMSALLQRELRLAMNKPLGYGGQDN